MLKKILIGTVVLIMTIGAIGFFNKKAIILYLATSTGKADFIAANHPLPWDQGPAAPSAGERPSNIPPNIIVILADDFGINDISAFGGGVADGSVPTPNIDDLANEGGMFEQAYAGNATCAPSRAMILTGRYATRTGFEFTPTPPGMGRIVTMFANDGTGPHPVLYDAEVAEVAPPFDKQGLPGSEVTIAEVLKTRGYHTAHIGKWHLGRGPEFGANAQGFDESLLMASGLYLPEDHPDAVNAKLDFDPIDKFLWARMEYAASFNEGEWFEPDGYLTDYYTNEAVNMIRANRSRPFFLYLAHWGAHTPLQAAKADYDALSHIENHRLRVYAAMIRAVDRSVGRIVETLEEEGLSDNTIIVFTSDNGGAGYIGLPDINNPYRGWKLTLFEGGIRVPLFVKWPAQIAPGTKGPGLATQIDIMPTLAAAAGAELPADRVIDGANLLPYLIGEPPQAPPHDAVFWQSGYYKVVRQGDWKLQVSQRPNKTWLFDLARDPTEQVNLAEARPDKRQELMALIEAHYAGARAPLYPYTLEAPVLIDKTGEEEATEEDEYIYWPN